MRVCITLMLTLLVSFAYGQKPLKDFYLKRSLKQDGMQWEFTVLEEDKHGVWHYNKSKFYFWYRAQHVLSTQGSSSGVLLHGECEAFYQNKQLALKGRFLKGLKHGEWLYWREDGTLSMSENWCRGEKKGLCRVYDENGNVLETIRVKGATCEREAGDSLIQSRKNGKYETITLRDDDGRIVRIEEKKNGKLHGKVKSYDDGKMISCDKYRDGELVEKKAKDEENNSDETKKGIFSFLKKKEKSEVDPSGAEKKSRKEKGEKDKKGRKEKE